MSAARESLFDSREMIERARACDATIVADFASCSPSDRWTTAEVFKRVVWPMTRALRDLIAAFEEEIGGGGSGVPELVGSVGRSQRSASFSIRSRRADTQRDFG